MSVTRLDITARDTLLNGQPFGSTGPYEVLRGSVAFAADPMHPYNRGITDLDKAPRTAAGSVEWSADFCLLQPTEPQCGKHRLLFEVVNRGRIRAFRVFDAVADTPDLSREAHISDGFLLRQGYTVAWCGWQWDVIRDGRLFGLEVPEALEGNSPVSGNVLCQWWPNTTTATLLLADRTHQPYPAADVMEREAILTVREHEHAPRQTIPREQWQFARVEAGKVVPDATHIYLATSFQPGRIYECVYRTQKAPVVGLGLLAVRDVVSFLRYGSGPLESPCTDRIDYAYGFGISQSGRFLRQYLYENLNHDEAGRIVFDGVMPHIAGARHGEFNCRFGQPSANTLEGPNTAFPFTDNEQTDTLTGQTDGLLRRLTAAGKLPKIFHTNSSAEYWRGDASLSHISADGTADVPLPECVRMYVFAGTQHTPGDLALKDTTGDGARGQHPLNSVDYSPLLRAALVNLDRWVSHGTLPPLSQYPQLANGTAVTARSLEAAFKAIPGVAFPAIIPQPSRLDLGPQWPQGIASWLPPRVGEPYTVFVAAVDQDGNETAGIRLPDLTVPLATYTGWNPRHPDQGAPEQLVRMHGSTLPFAPSRREREQRSDHRLSIEERYASKDAYLEQVSKAAEALIAACYLLPEDRDGIVQRAAQRYDFYTRRRGRPNHPYSA